MVVVLDKSCRENQNVLFFFFENCTIYEIMRKNTRQATNNSNTMHARCMLHS